VTGHIRADAFRAACAQFATGVAVVTTSTPEGDFGVTVSAFTPLTLEPPQVIVCLARTSSTWQAISQARVFAVNVLAADQLPLARLFATKQRDKFRQMPVISRQGIVGVPVLDGALSTLECGLAEAIMRDTHMVLIGEVVRMRHDRTKAPALYFRSRLYEGFEAARAGTPGSVGEGVRSSPGGGRS
jgi:3-hydroxy-9,10-secoandrosta-1,3,5(10)-triene-9,17-dione monooxygenase reductase component